MTVRGRHVFPAIAALAVLTGCSTTVSGAPAPQAAPVPATTSTTSTPPVVTTVPTTTTTTTAKPKPKPTTTRPSPTHTPTRTKPKAPPKPAVKSVTYLLTGSGTVSVRYLAAGSMHSLSHVGLPWRKTVPLSSGGRYEMDLTTGSDANVDAQVSVDGVVVGNGHNEGAGTGSLGGNY